jgi:hypothetical protein
MRKTLLKRKVITLTLSIMLLIFCFGGAAFSQALAITINDFVPFAQAVLVPCANGGAGEIVLIEGTLHIQQHVTINDNRANIKIHTQPQGASGVGLVTGDSYQGTGVTQEQDSIPITNGAFEFSFVNNFRLIGQGTDNNLQVHQNVHVTVDANGVVTTVVDNLSVDCN